MNRITLDKAADLFFQIDWLSSDAVHTECYAGRKVDFKQDLLPERLLEALPHKRSGDRITFDFGPGELVPEVSGDPRMLPRDRFDGGRVPGAPLEPRLGRFYPKGLLKNVAGIYRTDREPFRCVGLDNERFSADLRHPLAGKALRTAVTIGDVSEKSEGRGGGVRDWISVVTAGPGMQARLNHAPTDFFPDRPFDRQNEARDLEFYEKPRMVHHLDDTAREMVRTLYARLLRPDMRVLDLMASWHSHLPSGIPLDRVTGLGLNAQELSANPELSDRIVHDLNAEPVLPLPDAHFDAVICTVSVEYLIHPVTVFAEVARVLRPGGIFVITFSNRWFAPKAIRIWPELHEFERMGLVSEYFRIGGAFTGLHTYSLRGLDRPRHDKYYARTSISDPLYAVWASRA